MGNSVSTEVKGAADDDGADDAEDVNYDGDVDDGDEIGYDQGPGIDQVTPSCCSEGNWRSTDDRIYPGPDHGPKTGEHESGAE